MFLPGTKLYLIGVINPKRMHRSQLESTMLPQKESRTLPSPSAWTSFTSEASSETAWGCPVPASMTPDPELSPIATGESSTAPLLTPPAAAASTSTPVAEGSPQETPPKEHSSRRLNPDSTNHRYSVGSLGVEC